MSAEPYSGPGAALSPVGRGRDGNLVPLACSASEMLTGNLIVALVPIKRCFSPCAVSREMLRSWDSQPETMSVAPTPFMGQLTRWDHEAAPLSREYLLMLRPNSADSVAGAGRATIAMARGRGYLRRAGDAVESLPPLAGQGQAWHCYPGRSRAAPILAIWPRRFIFTSERDSRMQWPDSEARFARLGVAAHFDFPCIQTTTACGFKLAN